jgi:alkylation response protein AidB-like acyl-CoA dehydrogenase
LDAIQVHGGAGYMAEPPIEKLMRDAKMFEIGGGTNEIQLETIARSLLA